nr:MAG TPA: hypothetical protein [Caudoviricetes sp.]
MLFFEILILPWRSSFYTNFKIIDTVTAMIPKIKIKI